MTAPVIVPEVPEPPACYVARGTPASLELGLCGARRDHMACLDLPDFKRSDWSRVTGDAPLDKSSPLRKDRPIDATTFA